MASNNDALVGMFFLENSPDHDGYRTGQIKAALNGGYLILPDNFSDGPVQPMEMVAHEEIASELECGCKRWSFFNTRRDLDRFMAWITAPEKKETGNKVIKLTTTKH